MKSEFVSIVSHQLRSPLTNLRWAADFLISSDKEKLKEKEADYLKIMKENAVRMGELIDNLLIVSRIEQGRFPLKKEEVNLEDMIKEVIKDFEIFAEASNVKINIAIAGRLPPIFIDKFQIRLLLDNLLSNAMRYTKGGGKIEISLSRDNKNILFKIKDSGVGIPQRDQKYIFQKFFRAQNAQTYQTQGSGLGLYIAKCVAESSGGKISFKSEEGKGSTFWFTIPVK
jgi:signal transduction histidine kinase